MKHYLTILKRTVNSGWRDLLIWFGVGNLILSFGVVELLAIIIEYIVAKPVYVSEFILGMVTIFIVNTPFILDFMELLLEWSDDQDKLIKG